MAPVLGARVLGPLEVEGPDGPIVLTSRRQRAVLALLALHAGDVVSVDRLHEWLWGEEIPATAVKTLQTYLYRVRRAVGPALIDRVPGGYVLRIPRGAVDAHRFEDAAGVGLRSLEHGDVDGAAWCLRGALDEWRGDTPLVDAAGSLLGDAAITHLLELKLAAEDGLHEARLRLGEHELLVPDLEVAASEAPLRERRWEQLARALAGAGRPSDALRACGRARAALVEHAGVEPGPALRALEAELLATTGEDAPAASPLATSKPIPAPLGDVVGRDDDAERLTGLLRTHRLVTVVGPGGVGKTTLIRLARTAIGPRCWYVELDRLAPGAPVDHAVATALGRVSLPGADVAEAIGAVLARVEGVLVLDCCEHVLASAASLVRRVLSSSDGVRVVCTSREPLGVPGEAVLAVGPLEPSEAHELYRRRAADAGAAVPPDPVLDQLCTWLDHLPLAIEIAAAMGSALDAETLLARLTAGDDLEAGAGFPARHRSLAAAIEWSCALLTPDELAVLAHIAVFAGPFDMVAASEVAAAAGVGREGTTAALVRLVRRSLVDAQHCDGQVRYHLLTAVRTHARRRLQAAAQAEGASDAHLGWVLARADAAIPHLGGADQLEWFSRLDAIADEIPHAFRWAAGDSRRAADALPAATGLFHWWMASGRRAEGKNWTVLLARTATGLPRLDRVRALFHAGMMGLAAQLDTSPQLPAEAAHLAQGDGEAEVLARLFAATLAAMRGEDASEELLTLRVELPPGVIPAPFDRWGLFAHHLNTGDLEAARTVGRGLVDACMAAGDEHLAGAFMGGLTGCVDDAEARVLIGESRRIAEETGCPSCLSQALSWEVNEGMAVMPLAQLAEAASMADAIGDVAKVIHAATVGTWVLAEAGRHEDALSLAAAVMATRERARHRLVLPRRQSLFEAGRAQAFGGLEPEVRNRAERRGRRLTTTEMTAVLATAAAALPPRYRAPARSSP